MEEKRNVLRLKAVPMIASPIFLILALIDYDIEEFSDGYYTLLRIVLFGTFGYLAWFYHQRKEDKYLFNIKNEAIVWLMVFGAIIFNPIIKVSFDRHTWVIYDFVALVLICASWKDVKLFQKLFNKGVKKEKYRTNQRNYVVNSNIPWKRFWARSIDTMLFTYPLYFLLMYYFGGEHPFRIGYISGLIYLFVCEPFNLNMFGTTLGKWLLGIRVRNKNGEKLMFNEVYLRTGSVFLHGMGLNIPIVTLFFQYSQYKRLLKEGETTWDDESSFRVE